MTSVQTCTLVLPSKMNSTASRQLATPPMPEIGKRKSGSRPNCATICSAIGLTAEPQ